MKPSSSGSSSTGAAAARVASLSEHRTRKKLRSHADAATAPGGRLRPRVDRGAGQGLLAGSATAGDRPLRIRARPRAARRVPRLESGRAADTRPGFQRLVEDAMTGSFDCVLVYHSSRFARNTIEAKQYKRLLRRELGIDVISVTQPLGGDADDPAAFLTESVHEIFDEYYSVSLSFWVKMGLKEKARQGLLTGSLPWGYRKGADGIAEPDEERARTVRRMFELYASGRHTHRTIAEWLNSEGLRTRKGTSLRRRLGAGNAVQRLLLRLRLRAARPQQADPWPAPTARRRGALRPRPATPPSPAPAPSTPAGPRPATCSAGSHTASAARHACKEPQPGES